MLYTGLNFGELCMIETRGGENMEVAAKNNQVILVDQVKKFHEKLLQKIEERRS